MKLDLIATVYLDTNGNVETVIVRSGARSRHSLTEWVFAETEIEVLMDDNSEDGYTIIREVKR
jgi:hypothetical protein